MSAETDYLQAERQNVLSTLVLIEDLLGKSARGQYETIALGKLLQDLYSGIERILRMLLEQKGVHVQKTESCHKDLLLAAKNRSLINQRQFEALGELLVFRHVQVYGYGFMLDDRRFAAIGNSVVGVCRGLLSHLASSDT